MLFKEPTVIQRMRAVLKVAPNAQTYVFLGDGDDEELFLTLQQLDLRARAIAAKLQQYTKKGDRAVLLYPPGLDFLTAFWGCMYAGVVAVPMPMSTNMKALAEMLHLLNEDCAPKVLLTIEVIEPMIAFGQMQQPHLVIPTIIEATDSVADELADTFETVEVAANDIAFLQYTSGSTAQPKGVMVSHQNIMANVTLINDYTQVLEKKIGVAWLPHFHDMGLIGHFIIAPLVEKGTLIFMSPLSFIEKPLRWLKAMAKYKAVISAAPNFAYQLCAKKVTAEEKTMLDLSHWETALTGSEPVRYDVLTDFSAAFEGCGFKKTAFTPCYGMAEATLLVSAKPLGTVFNYMTVDKRALSFNQIVPYDVAPNRAYLISCGTLGEGYTAKIVKPNTQTVLTGRQIGEIWLKGKSVTMGYWNKKDLSEATFHNYTDSGEGPFLSTGDLGFINDHGELYITGRIKDLIIIRGKNYYPQDIELVVNESHTYLRKGCAAAFSVEEEVRQQEQLVVVSELKKICPKEAYEEVAQAIYQQVSARCHLQPQTIVLIKPNSLPKTTSGKIQRLRCKQKMQQNKLKVLFEWHKKQASISTEKVAVVAWLTEQVQLITQLAPNQIKPNISFFDLGLESVQLPELLEALRANFDKNITIEALLQHASIEALANYYTQKPTKVEKIAHNDDKQAQKNASLSKEDEGLILPDFSLLD